MKFTLSYRFIEFFPSSIFPFLKIFKNKTNISIENLSWLIILKKIDFDIQIICNYLSLFIKITEADLYIPNISDYCFFSKKKIIPDKIIPNTEWKELIYEYLYIELLNYDQIFNYITAFIFNLKN